MVSQYTVGHAYKTGSYVGNFNKELKVPKSIEKGKELILKASEQGEPEAIAAFGKSLEESSQSRCNVESIRIYSLGAYQGHPLCMLRLSEPYSIAFLKFRQKDGPSALKKKMLECT